jgi:hypothetical protein
VSKIYFINFVKFLVISYMQYKYKNPRFLIRIFICLIPWFLIRIFICLIPLFLRDLNKYLNPYLL